LVFQLQMKLQNREEAPISKEPDDDIASVHTALKLCSSRVMESEFCKKYVLVKLVLVAF